MTQPTAEAWDAAAGRADAYMAGVAEGRRLERERLAPLVEAVKAWRDVQRPPSPKATRAWIDHQRAAVNRALVAAFDAFTRGDTESP